MDKKVLIFNAALELFVKQDIDKTSTSSIAKKAGVSNGTLFHYFPTKNDLIFELYIILKTEMFDHIYSGKLIEQNDLKTMIIKGCFNAVEWICHNPQKHIYIHKIYKSNYHDLINEDELPENYLLYLKTIEEGINKKILKNIPAVLMASLINTQISALADYYINSDIPNDDALNKVVFQMIWNCIKN